MMNECKIVEDLLALYEEDLLQPETKGWVERHLTSCASCSEKIGITIEPQLIKNLQPEKNAEAMIAKAKLKLTIYQLLFVTLSFLLAMSTSLFSNDGFHFIMTYFILGAVTFYFYRSWLLTFVLAFIPIAIWTVIDTIYSYGAMSEWIAMAPSNSGSIFQAFINLATSSIFLALLHTFFALLGVVFVKCLLLAFTKRGDSV